VRLRLQQFKIAGLLRDMAKMAETDRHGSSESESDYARGLYAGSAMAFELAVKWLNEAFDETLPALRRS